MTDLLERALAQLDAGGPLAARRACWLARAALEARVRHLLQVKGVGTDKASDRALLTCLEGAYADDRDLVARADYAWGRLSEACHQHAYEIAPTWAEARRLLELVASLNVGQAESTTVRADG